VSARRRSDCRPFRRRSLLLELFDKHERVTMFVDVSDAKTKIVSELESGSIV
jgi:hypothetical protein